MKEVVVNGKKYDIIEEYCRIMDTLDRKKLLEIVDSYFITTIEEKAEWVIHWHEEE
jgi:hypothetical protein